MKEKIILSTENILLREIEGSDIENVYLGLSNPEVIKYYGVSFNSLKDTEVQMEWFSNSKQHWFAICSLDNNEFYGAGGLNDISQEHKKAEIGLWLLPEYWGKGIMREVLPLICDYGFKELKLHRIEGYVEADNVKCKNALSKLDFEFEGTMRDCEVKNDKFVSIEIYAKLNNYKLGDDN